MTSASLISAGLNRLERETGMLLATVDSLSAAEMAGPSRFEGWTLGHVVTHLARNADALCNLVDWAVSGDEMPAYSSPEERDRAVEEGARRPHTEIKRDLAEASARFAAKVGLLRGPLSAEEVAILGHPVQARSLVALREYEVVIHHYDLGTVWTLDEADPDAQLAALETAVGLLADRDDVPGIDIETVERDSLRLGDGGVKVSGPRAGVLAWLIRGVSDEVRCDGELPRLPDIDMHP